MYILSLLDYFDIPSRAVLYHLSSTVYAVDSLTGILKWYNVKGMETDKDNPFIPKTEDGKIRSAYFVGIIVGLIFGIVFF